MIARTLRHALPRRAAIRRTDRYGLSALPLAGIALGIGALGIGAPASATSVSPTIAVNGVGYTGAPLKTGDLYTVKVNLNPKATADYGKTTASKVYSCDRQHVSSPEYCVSDIRSHLTGAPVISGLTLDGYDLSEVATVSGDTLSFLDGSYIPGTHLINFTETFSEARDEYKYFYGNKNPELDGYSPTASVNSIFIPDNFSGSLLSCGFSGSMTYDSSYKAQFNTVAQCSLNLTYAFPVTPPPSPTPTPLPPPVSGVPEPMTWAMMVLGFGVIGAAMRRKTRLVVAQA